MSRTRHAVLFDRKGHSAARLTTLSWEFEDKYRIPEHFHDTDQLVFASKGVMTIQTEDGFWIVPTQRAVWIPSRTVHSITMSGQVSMRTLYFSPKYVRRLPRSCCVINIDPLLKELIVHACTTTAWTKDVPNQKHLLGTLLHHLQAASSSPLQLPRPSDPRAARVAEKVLADPGNNRALSGICEDSGASKRTIERLFLEETRLSLGRWRQQARLLHAIRLIASGEKVISAALEAGYNSPSAFIVRFKKLLGCTPGRYFETDTV
jgi:AraC-like DNA-binding protein/quercetin dioxygenase-like cupin family protein